MTSYPADLSLALFHQTKPGDNSLKFPSICNFQWPIVFTYVSYYLFHSLVLNLSLRRKYRIKFRYRYISKESRIELVCSIACISNAINRLNNKSMYQSMFKVLINTHKGNFVVKLSGTRKVLSVANRSLSD